MSVSGERCRNLCCRIRKQFEAVGILYLYETEDITYVSKTFIRSETRNGTGGNKLRTYRKFKQIHKTENCLKGLLPRTHRIAFAKFRCGVASLRIETGRYERLSVDERTCIFSQNQHVESQEHELLPYPLYDDLREKLFRELQNHVDNFNGLPDDEKLSVILGCDNPNVIKISAKTCCDILYMRRGFRLSHMLCYFSYL